MLFKVLILALIFEKEPCRGDGDGSVRGLENKFFRLATRDMLGLVFSEEEVFSEDCRNNLVPFDWACFVAEEDRSFF